MPQKNTHSLTKNTALIMPPSIQLGHLHTFWLNSKGLTFLSVPLFDGLNYLNAYSFTLINVGNFGTFDQIYQLYTA